VIQTSQHLGFALETPHPFRVAGKFTWQHLERDLAAELFVLGAPDLAHPARAERAGDPIVS